MSNTDEFDDKLMADVSRLATDISPERDLWPDIEAAITAPAGRRQSRWMPWLAQAAAVVLLVGASSTITYHVVKEDRNVVNGAMADTARFDTEFVAFGSGHELGSGFRHARNNLEAELEFELDRLSPEARQEVEDNLAVIRNAIAEINEALVRDPDNVLLQELLLRTYRDELTVMREVGDLTKDVMSRNDI